MLRQLAGFLGLALQSFPVGLDLTDTASDCCADQEQGLTPRREMAVLATQARLKAGFARAQGVDCNLISSCLERYSDTYLSKSRGAP